MTVNSTTKFEAKIQYLSSSHDQVNGFSSASSRLCFGYSNTGEYNHWYWGIGNKNHDTSIPADLLPHTFFIDLSNMTYGYDDVVMNSTANFTPTENSPTLFARKGNPTVMNYCYQNLYFCRFYDNGVLIRDFVPCYNKNIEQYGLYDTVTEEFFGNLGTEKFYGKSFLEEGEDCKFFGFEQYFVDNGIVRRSGNLNTTITGTGAKADPYIINSSEDFWWALGYLNWQNKSFILACDVVLNEEKFDETGNASGGDGIVYSWTLSRATQRNVVFDGNNHTVFGLYYNDENVTGMSLFRNIVFTSLKNISIDNLFLKGYNNVAAFSNLTDVVGDYENCHVLKGTITGRSQLAGVCVCAKNITNCSNSATIIGYDNIAGVACAAHNYHSAKNYGDVSCEYRYVAGIGFNHSISASFYYCENYGDITSNGTYAAGISAGCYKDKKRFYYCKNFGDIVANSYAGGILTYVCGSALIYNCENYGTVHASAELGNIVATIYRGDVDGELVVKNCYSIQRNATPFIGTINRGNVVLENNKIDVENFIGSRGIVVYFTQYNNNLVIKNLYIKLQAESIQNDMLIKYLRGETKTTIQNVLIESNLTTKSLCLKNNLLSVDGVVIKSPTKNIYYGSDFSGFNISWKTGAISLNSMSSTGCFTPRLTEENLNGMGFQKKTM